MAKPQTPRAVLTSLINALTTSPHDPDTTAPTTSENALKSLPHSHRPLLVTLHVLFPSIVLPALDLLDRDLVARVVRDDTHAADVDLDGEDPVEDRRPEPDQDAEDRGGAERVTGSDRRDPASFYVVRSVASTISRRKKTEADPSAVSSAGTKYLVHVDAWNCTCANFAFEAFPPPGGGEDEIEILGADAEDLDEAVPSSPEWQFGGLSLDGLDRGGVPCCKHLLACLLAEQWGSVLGSYVTERRMSRAAIAGTVGDM
ncbi:hypothetical protein CkaCkLH20_04052 [Colletotrichum karsti]|uniref:SWIM-type domain-containing protein n=1 Tax=Colletotrichum karsti TaxID=1095194 RepID=A0A9P6IGS6_9PEZI|nr:uncharacterized protein CkaCkLH20_04052 [Colletotrichum karsti]KAF9878560.1 hypothetical protein CkaCkLH20_04052 [Colletotrichum karsti]